MALLASLRRILNNTPGTATDIDFNFQALENHVNTEVINRNGAVAMTQPLAGVPAVNDNEYATLGQVAGGVPAGVMWEFAGLAANIPDGWLACDGQAYSSTDPLYVELFAAIGYTWGDAGGGNFNVPDFRKRVAIGRSDPGDTGFDTVGIMGGSNDLVVPTHQHDLTAGGEHTHTTPELTHTASQAAHSHSVDPPATTSSSAGAHSHSISGDVRNTGSGPLGLADGNVWGGVYGAPLNVVTGSTNTTGSHTHSTNIGSFTSGSATPSIGVASHPAGVTGSAGPSNTDATGESPTDKNLPQYGVVLKMIKL